MKTFSGFPAGKLPMVTLPETVFTEIVPAIDDLDELKTTLHVLWRLGKQRETLRYVRHSDLVADRVLLGGLGEGGAAALDSALARAVQRGTLLLVHVPDAGGALYFANSPKGRAAVEAIARGEWPAEAEPAARPNIFTLYEQNVGLLTPLIADELRDAERTYSPEWIEDAFREAIRLNRRNWKYILAILQRWREEGGPHEADRTDHEKERRRYVEGKYSEYIEH